MPLNVSNSWTDPAIRVASAGLGFIVGGPLGAALGGLHGTLLAGVLGASGDELVRMYTEKFGNSAIKKMFGAESGSLVNELKESSNGLEQVYRKALRHSLAEIHACLADFEDWFANWDICLASVSSLDISPVHPDQLAADDLDHVFQRTMEQLDAQGSAISRKSLSLKQERRSIPEALLAKLTDLLPEHFRKKFLDLIHKPEYEQAWKETQKQFQDSVKSLLASIKSDTSQILTGQGGLNEKLDELLRRTIAGAEKDQRIDRAEARALSAEAEAEEWKRKFLELTKSDPSLDELLSSGDFEAAAHKKSHQIEKQSSGLAQSYFELGTIHELRFDWQKALENFREAWRIERNSEYGFRYACSAQKQNEFSDAINIFEDLRRTCRSAQNLRSILNNLAMLYHDTQRMQEAEETYREALSITRQLARDNPRGNVIELATSLNNIASIYRDTQRMREAEKAYVEALHIARSSAPIGSNEHLPTIAMTLNNLALLYRRTQRLQEALEANSEALSLRRELARDRPEAYLPSVATSLNNLANLYRDTKRMEEAEEAYLEALPIQRKLARENPGAYLPALALTLNNLAILHKKSLRTKEAKDFYREALSIRRELAIRNPDAYLPAVSQTLDNLANLLSDMQNPAHAEKAYLEALSIRRKFAQKNPQTYLPAVATTLDNLANLLSDTERVKEAEEGYREALAIQRRLAQDNPNVYTQDVAITLNNLAVLCRNANRIDEATMYCREAETLLSPFWDAHPEHNGDLMARLLWSLALLCEMRGELEEACNLASRASSAAYNRQLKQEIEELIEGLYENE